MPDEDESIFTIAAELLGVTPEEARASLGAPPTHHVRGPERRQQDRRHQLGFKARRRDDVERNRRRRAWLVSFLTALPTDTMTMWIDGWLSVVTDSQLATFVDQATNFLRDAPKPRRRGRPAATGFLPHVSDAGAFIEWCRLTTDLTNLSAARRRHYAPANRTRRGTARSLEHRQACLASAIGQRVDRLGLFADFFDRPTRFAVTLKPQRMAARLLRREAEFFLNTCEARWRERATQAESAEERQYWQAHANWCAAERRRLPSWQRLLDHLIAYRRLK